MSTDGKYDPPKESTGDYVHAVVRSALGAIPVGGSAAVELFNIVIAPPLERRRKRWQERVGEKLEELEQAGRIKIDELFEDEVFTTTLLQASQAAVRNHHEEKLEALRNAVINATLPNPPDESLQLMFVHMVDTFTVWHLRILKIFGNPQGWFQANNRDIRKFTFSSSISQLIEAAYPELATQEALVKIVVDELSAKGLYAGGGLHVMMTAQGAYDKRTTELGDKFLKFISEPQR